MRYPVEAEKDRRIVHRVRASAFDHWSAETSAISAHDAHILAAAARHLCPHVWLDDVVYRTVVLAIDRQAATDPSLRNVLGAGIVKMRDQGFDSASDPERVVILRNIEQTQFFLTLLRLVIYYLYDDPVVWAGCGYEGVRGCSETGVRERINDLDWLPEVEVVPHEKTFG